MRDIEKNEIEAVNGGILGLIGVIPLGVMLAAASAAAKSASEESSAPAEGNGG